MDGGGRTSARRAGGRARAGRGRERDRCGSNRRLHVGGRPSRHGELRGGGADPGAPGLDRGDLRGLRGRALSAPRERRPLPDQARATSRSACCARWCPLHPTPGASRSSAGARGRSPIRCRPRSSARSTASPPRPSRPRHGQQCRALHALPHLRQDLPAGRQATRGRASSSCSRSWPRRSRRWSPPRVRSRSRGRAGAIRAARDAFYKGDIAKRIADYHAREGGLMELEDLAEFEAEVAPALKTTFHDTKSRPAASVPGAGVLADAEPDRALRLARARPQHAARAPPPGRGHEAGLRRPRGLLRRSALREGAGGGAALEGLRRSAARPDPRGPRLA